VALLLSSTQQMPASACSSADVNTAASSRYVTVHTANCKLQLPRGNSFAARQRSNDAAGLSLSDPNRPLSERQKGRHLLRQYHVPVVSGHKQSSGLKDASRHPGQHSYITRPANKSVGARLLTAIAGHSHISTIQRYIDVNSEQPSEVVGLFPNRGRHKAKSLTNFNSRLPLPHVKDRASWQRCSFVI